MSDKGNAQAEITQYEANRPSAILHGIYVVTRDEECEGPEDANAARNHALRISNVPD